MNAWNFIRHMPSTLFGNTVVKYNDRIYSIAGQSGGAAVNVVTASEDGNNYEIIARNPANLQPRSLHASCVFNQRMWVVGGLGNQGPFNLILSSEDGLNWDAMKTPVVPPVVAGQLVAFETKKIRLVFLGGLENGSASNTVAISEDGLNWEVVNTEGPMWTPRAYHKCIVFDNRVWVIGGMNQAHSVLNDVWYSSDLVHWHQVPGIPWAARMGHSLACYDNRMWVISGLSDSHSTTCLADVWYSQNGVNWKKGFDISVPFAYGVAETINERLFVAGGKNSAGAEINTVYQLELE